MKIFGFNITRAEKNPYKVYNNDCAYCPFWKKIDYESEYEGGYCKELDQLVSNNNKHCKYKVK